MIHIDFGNYCHKGVETNSGFNEFDKHFFTITPSGIRLIYDAPEQGESEIYLNHTAFRLMEFNYKYKEG